MGRYTNPLVPEVHLPGMQQIWAGTGTVEFVQQHAISKQTDAIQIKTCSHVYYLTHLF